jgi:hypothetical protein
MTILQDTQLYETMGYRRLYTQQQELPGILVQQPIHNHTEVKHVQLPLSGTFHNHESPSAIEYRYSSCNL